MVQYIGIFVMQANLGYTWPVYLSEIQNQQVHPPKTVMFNEDISINHGPHHPTQETTHITTSVIMNEKYNPCLWKL